MSYMADLIVAATCAMAAMFILIFAIRRNRTIQLSGSDDPMLFVLIALLIILAFPIVGGATAAQMVRNFFIYAALFSTLVVKRGLSTKGFEKFFVTIPWSKILRVWVEPSTNNRIKLTADTTQHRYKILIRKFRLQEAMDILAANANEVYLNPQLNTQVDKWKKSKSHYNKTRKK